MKRAAIGFTGIVFLLATGCGGGGGGSSDGASTETSVTSINAPQKAKNAYYLVGSNSKNIYAIANWMEAITIEINKVALDPQKAPIYGLYKDYNIKCPAGGFINVNGNISLNGGTHYKLDLSLSDCIFDGTDVDGGIALTGTVEGNTSVDLQFDMKDLEIGKGQSNGMQVNALLTVDNDRRGETNYRLEISGTVKTNDYSVEYKDYAIAIQQNKEGGASATHGEFEISSSNYSCLAGKYDLATKVPLTESGSLRINDATIEVHADKTAEIQFNNTKISVDDTVVLSCP